MVADEGLAWLSGVTPGGNPVGKLGWKNTVSGKCTGDSNI